MMNLPTPQADLAAKLMRGLQNNRSGALEQMLDDCRVWKPGGKDYDTKVKKRRDYVEDRQHQHAEGVLRGIYKNSDTMIPHVVPYLKHYVEQMMIIYRSAPLRWLTVAGQRDEEETRKLTVVYRDAMVDSRMRSLEKIGRTARVGFVRLSWDPYYRRVNFALFWPDSVYALPDPEYPDQLERSSLVVAKIVSEHGVNPKKGKAVYEVFYREPKAWYRYTVTEDGSRQTPGELEAQQEYGFLPWIAVHFEDTGALFPELPTDDLAAADTFTAQASNRDHLMTMQAHTPVVVIGEMEEGDWRWTPDETLELRDGDIKTLQLNPQIEAVDRAIERAIERDLLLRGASPAQATSDPKYMAALTLQVLNQSRDEAREATVPFARDMEVRRLWPTLRKVVETQSGLYGNKQITWPADAEFHWEPGPLSISLDPASDYDLSRKRVEDGTSTWPRELVRAGAAANEYEAIEMLKQFAAVNGELSGLVVDLSSSDEKEPGEKRAEERKPEEQPEERPDELETKPQPEEAVDPNTALNGAQVTALLEIVERVATGQIPRDAGVNIIEASFPLTAAQANKLLGSIGRGFKPEAPQDPSTDAAVSAEK